MSDTSPEMKKAFHDLIMQKSGTERFLMGVSMCVAARQIVLSSLPDDLSESERRVMLLKRYYSRDFDAKELLRIEEYFVRHYSE